MAGGRAGAGGAVLLAAQPHADPGRRARLPERGARLHDPTLPENQAYYGTTLENKLAYGSAYLALVGLLAVMAHDVHEMLAGLR